jgi:hypothetical protein
MLQPKRVNIEDLKTGVAIKATPTEVHKLAFGSFGIKTLEY